MFRTKLTYSWHAQIHIYVLLLHAAIWETMIVYVRKIVEILENEMLGEVCAYVWVLRDT